MSRHTAFYGRYRANKLWNSGIKPPEAIQKAGFLSGIEKLKSEKIQVDTKS